MLPFKLILIQATPFCNIDCKYCYLYSSERLNKKQITIKTVEKIFEKIFSSELINYAEDIEIDWHAGEPLVSPIEFYKSMIQTQKEYIKRYSFRNKIQNSLVTNGTLISKKWCSFFVENDFFITLSIDGPKELHDKYRIKRNKQGTFNEALKGLKLLNEFNIKTSVLTTVTNETLKIPPSEFLLFYIENNIKYIGLNFELKYMNNLESNGIQHEKYYFNWFQELYHISLKHDILIREFYNMNKNYIENKNYPVNKSINIPFSILSFDVNGNFSTFSPEFLSDRHPKYGNFIFGNVYKNEIIDLLNDNSFNKVYSDIKSGVTICKESCSYFSVCGGGAPIHKLYDNDTILSSENTDCKFRIQLFSNIIKNAIKN